MLERRGFNGTVAHGCDAVLFLRPASFFIPLRSSFQWAFFDSLMVLASCASSWHETGVAIDGLLF